MFTGIIQEKGKVKTIDRNRSGGTLVISAPRLARRIRMGASVSVNGACLTVTGRHQHTLTFDIHSETWSRTNFRDLAPGAPVNLEAALSMGDPLDGHLVQGHVDGTGEVLEHRKEGGGSVMEVGIPKRLAPFIAEKGSVSIDGVSLTVTRANHSSFQVALIPHTLQKTNLSGRRTGDRVNLEIDPIARYVQRQRTHGR